MTTYVCPLHSDVQSPRPETCPRCGIRLEPRPEERATAGKKVKTKNTPVRAKR